MQHGISDAYYSYAPPGRYQCFLVCLCGYGAQGDTWEEAGRDLDIHLKEATKNGEPIEATKSILDRG